MNERAILAQAKKVRDVASFAFGEPITAMLSLETAAWGRGQRTTKDVFTEYRLWIGTHRVKGLDSVSFNGTWKEVLGLIEWLQDVEAPISYRDR